MASVAGPEQSQFFRPETLVYHGHYQNLRRCMKVRKMSAANRLNQDSGSFWSDPFLGPENSGSWTSRIIAHRARVLVKI